MVAFPASFSVEGGIYYFGLALGVFNSSLTFLYSFGDISGETIGNDAQKLSIGFIIMFLFVQLMLGKFNLVEQRVSLFNLDFT